MFVNQTRGSVDIIFCVFFLGGDALKILNHRKKKKLILKELSKGGHKNQTQKTSRSFVVKHRVIRHAVLFVGGVLVGTLVFEDFG